MSARSHHSEYQPLVGQEETDVGEGRWASSSRTTTTPGHRRTGRPGSIDLTKLDNAFKRLVDFASCAPYLLIPPRWTESIAQKVKRKKKVSDHSRKQIWRSVFEPTVLGIASSGAAVRSCPLIR